MASVSVIIPTYNRAAFVGPCVESLLSSGIADLEVLVVDDGGSDDTERVVRSMNGPVRYLRQQNAGPARARNYGARESHGRYLCFLDSDDEWLPEGPARLFAALESQPAQMVAFGDTQMGNDSDGYVSFVGLYGGAAFAALPAATVAPDLRVMARSPFFMRLATRNVMFLGSLMMRRDAFAAIGGFHEALRGAADWDLFLRLAARYDVMYLAAPPIAKYLKHAEGMANDSDHMNRDFMLTLAHVLEAVPDLPDGDRQYVERLLRKHRFDLAYNAYDRGRLDEAREGFLEAARLSGPSVTTAAYLALTYAPPTVVQGIRRLKRRVMGG